MRDALRAALPSLLSVLLALLVCLLAIAVVQGSFETALAAYGHMFAGGLGDWSELTEGAGAAVVLRPLGESAVKAALLLLTGLSVAMASRAGLFNIGAQGQLVVGALAAAVVGAKVALPAALHLPLALLAAAAAGALWALPAAVLKLRRGVHEVISTIMLNWVAIFLVESWLVVGPLRASVQGSTSHSGTDEILATAALPRLLGSTSRLHVGFPLALLLAVAVWAYLFRTRRGFETRASGLGSEAARAAGISVARRSLEAFLLAGALAGLAGALLVLGTEGNYPGTITAQYGFDGIAISLLGGNHPLGVSLHALFFGVLRAGGTRMQLLGVHKSFPELIQGLALLFVAGRAFWQHALVRLGRAQRVHTEVPTEVSRA